jgi:hypothetical protein
MINWRTQELDLYQWILTKDSDWGEGYSSAEFHLNSQGKWGESKKIKEPNLAIWSFLFVLKIHAMNLIPVQC